MDRNPIGFRRWVVYDIGEHFRIHIHKNAPHPSLTIGEHYAMIISIIVPQKEKRQWPHDIVRYRNCSEAALTFMQD